MPLPRLPQRVDVYHTAAAGNTPEAWSDHAAQGLRAAVSSLSNDKALSASAVGQFAAMPTHQVRTEYSAEVVVHALLVDVVTADQFLVLAVKQANKRDAFGKPDHLIATCAIQVPKATLA